ncbi:MAG TPA: alpha/beta fold hydrolase [Caulobacteraceae bacterium]|nr:alpha/beta fold hydrolase [Caulobacteraceae bacterium]
MGRWILIALAALSLTSCGPVIQQAWTPGAGFRGPRLEPHAFVSFDGARLGLQEWLPDGEPWAVIVGVHGMDDYANAFDLAGPYWAKDGIATIAYDQRGFGRSPERGVWAGDALYTEDLRTITALVRARYPHAIVAVAGESMGGAVTIEAFASPRPPNADRVVLLSPSVWGWSTQPLLYKTTLWLAAHVDGPLMVNPPDWLTARIYASDNIDELRRMGRDPLESWGARADALFGLVNTMEQASREVGLIRTPLLYMAGAHDEIIPVPAHIRAAKGLTASQRSAFYAHGWHLLIVDRQRDVVFKDVESFLRDPAAPLPSGAPPIDRASHAAGDPIPTAVADAR